MICSRVVPLHQFNCHSCYIVKVEKADKEREKVLPTMKVKLDESPSHWLSTQWFFQCLQCQDFLPKYTQLNFPLSVITYFFSLCLCLLVWIYYTTCWADWMCLCLYKDVFVSNTVIRAKWDMKNQFTPMSSQESSLWPDSVYTIATMLGNLKRVVFFFKTKRLIVNNYLL